MARWCLAKFRPLVAAPTAAAGSEEQRGEDEQRRARIIEAGISGMRPNALIGFGGGRDPVPRARWAVFSPSVENLVAQLTRLPDRIAHRATARVSHPAEAEGRGARARRGADRGEGARPLLPRARQPDRGGGLRDLHHARRDHSLICVVEQPVDVVSIERTAEFVALPRARRRALAARRCRAERPAHRRAAAAASSRTVSEEVVLATNPNMTGEATRPSRRPATRAGPGDGARERPPRRRRPRVRRRGHPGRALAGRREM